MPYNLRLSTIFMRLYNLLPALLVALIAYLLWPSQPQPERNDLSYQLAEARHDLALKSARHDTIRDTLVQVVTRWKERPVLTESDRCDSCCEVGFAYMIAYEACTTELAASSRAITLLDTIIQIDSTALIQARKDVVKERRKGKVGMAISFVVGVFVGRGL